FIFIRRLEILIDMLKMFMHCTFMLDTLVNLFTVHRDFFRSIDPNTNLITFYTKHSHADLVSNHKSFPDTSSQNQHVSLLAKCKTCNLLNIKQKHNQKLKNKIWIEILSSG